MFQTLTLVEELYLILETLFSLLVTLLKYCFYLFTFVFIFFLIRSIYLFCIPNKYYEAARLEKRAELIKERDYCYELIKEKRQEEEMEKLNSKKGRRGRDKEKTKIS